MGWTQVEYIDAKDVVVPPPSVKKQIWDGEKFVPVMLHRINGTLTDEQKVWLNKNFGPRGPRWDYSLTGIFYVMDEKVYSWFQLKWGKNG